ncbi:hypothetical protein AD006_01485 [Pseudonocardia sp. EC080610-09]|uniref:hypothetical protein n=1 Tax=unclassified Pseudonocardia TaxID=2619320 RepID=UPI0006CB29BD|nr:MULTISPECIES: hypothetical protein [unclassified Pseudonocardia]ALE74980.1 hypothetical protein FRP1_22295 [Pseudonocardia sp. EC080625-04]ALL74327.1 hypothetical protein AD006_01485 [Pseudonocardia sp. EC080610-09]ALL81350.1 hypothetical protein AD017_09310 [Pseudonocardia sp. EC080619-01]
MTTKQTRLARITAAVTMAAAAALVPAGVASAAPAETPPFTGCTEGNQKAVVEALPSTAEVANYTVTVYAKPGAAQCFLGGTPTDFGFSLNGSPRPADVQPTGEDGYRVPFGDGAPVTFDIHVPDSGGPAHANETTFKPIPGSDVTFTAYGPITVDAGMTAGPITSAAR